MKTQIGSQQASMSGLTHSPSALLQRKCDCGNHTIAGGECSACSKEHGATLQRSAMNQNDITARGDSLVPPIVHEVLRSSGQPLDSNTRAFMEPRFGHDFSRVRVHTDGRADESTREVNALAYTVENDVVFQSGRYAPRTSGGQWLLAHELTHVVQQGGLHRSSGQRLTVGSPGDASEQAADRVADEVTSDAAAENSPAGISETSTRVSRLTHGGHWATGLGWLQRLASCGPPEECPAREPGELRNARSGPMVVSGVSNGVQGVLVSNFNSGSSQAKRDLNSNREWAQFLGSLVTQTGRRWSILGFTDCHGEERANAQLRLERAIEISNLLPMRARAQVNSFAAAPAGECVAENGTAAGRSFNRSALIKLDQETIDFDPETITATPHYEACFDGTTLFANKNGRSASCPARTGNIGVPTPNGVFCIRRQGEAQVGGGLRGRLLQDRSRWYLIEPEFSTTRSRMQIHPGTFSSGCVTVTDQDCFSSIENVLNSTGTVTGQGYDGYPPGNADGVTNPRRAITCVGRLVVRSAPGSCAP